MTFSIFNVDYQNKNAFCLKCCNVEKYYIFFSFPYLQRDNNDVVMMHALCKTVENLDYRLYNIQVFIK